LLRLVFGRHDERARAEREKTKGNSLGVCLI
jgi:hypothetical protein